MIECHVFCTMEEIRKTRNRDKKKKNTLVMSDNKIHKYFNRKCSKWNIVDFLNECDLEPFDKKIDDYLKSLQNIKAEKGMRRKKANQLLDLYRKARKNFFKYTRK